MKTEEKLYKKLKKRIKYFFNDNENIELIRQFKSEVCKQQRANCVQAYYDNNDPNVGNMTAILNAPEP